MNFRRHLAKGRALRWAVGFTLLSTLWSGIGIALGSTSLLVNHEFATDLSGWEIAGDVQHSSGFAVLIDDTTTIGSLHQSAAPAPGTGFFELTFDFAGALSNMVPQGTLLDIAFASIYLGDNPFVAPGNAGSFDEVISLFDLDANGLRNVIAGAILSDTPGRAGWTRFNYTFQTARVNVTPFIEIVDQNTLDADGSLAVDSFELNQVVDPASDGDGDGMSTGVENRLGFDPDVYASRFVLAMVRRQGGMDTLRYSEVKSGVGAYVLKFKADASATFVEVDRFEPTPAEEGPDYEIDVVNPSGRGIYQVFFDTAP